MTAFRVYADDELGADGYPPEFHQLLKHVVRSQAGHRCIRCGHPYRVGIDGIMEPASDQAANLASALGVSPRTLESSLELVADDCDLLLNAEVVKASPRRHWSACDMACVHRGPYRVANGDGWDEVGDREGDEAGRLVHAGAEVQALWRILTVHHLDGHKANNRWWNLVALDQRCHLEIQGKVQMERVWPWEHSAWFRPYVAGYYASVYLGEELTRSEVDARLDELLALERAA